ncbi:inositol-tetrakisphosphate 1-kinase-like isoform X2 [Lineus longissimus]|uniref:inositol-tetrakisphosphate 1-kinase-like isoform X2 n=1 Tax=Lineus longissimus TaxID=88925 RepID=UPI002B4D66E4
MPRVGVWITEKKYKKLNFHHFEEVCRDANIEVVTIDLEKSLEDQGPFDIIIHKISDVMVKAEFGNHNAQNLFHTFQNYIMNHPEIVVIDPVENIRKLMDRGNQYRIVQECQFGQGTIYTPPFVELHTKDVETNKRLLEEGGVGYPLVCKASVSQALDISHQMAIIFSEKGLQDISPPCVAQTFINHGAVLYKVFVIGDYHFVVERPSLKNFHPGDHETIFFDSHNVSKPHSSSFLNRNHDGEQVSLRPMVPVRGGMPSILNHNLDLTDRNNSPVKPSYTLLESLAQNLKEKFGLELFGIDVIISAETKQYAVIDVNNFPGYDGIPNFFPVLLAHVQDVLKRKPKSQPEECASKMSLFNAANHKIEDHMTCFKNEENQNSIAASFN